MQKIATMTFIIGKAAAVRTREQLHATRRLWKKPSFQWQHGVDALGDFLDRQLLEKVDGFDVEIRGNPVGTIRLTWEPIESAAGILYAIVENQIRTITLLLGDPAAGSGQPTINRLRRDLGAIDGYRAALGLLDAAPRPLIATLCCAGLSPNPQIETAQFTFAAVFFSRQEAFARDAALTKR